MPEAFICDYVRTPIGRFGSPLACVRADDLAAVPLKALAARRPGLDLEAIDEVSLGCAKGEDNRNVARMALLLAGFPVSVPGTTINRLCGSGMDAVVTAARAIRAGEISLSIAGGVENMSRAPFVLPKAETAFSRSAESLRHHDRLALRQPSDEDAVWSRFNARYGREGRARLRGVARRPGCIRAPVAAEGRASGRKRPACPRDHAGHDPSAQE